MAEDKYTFDEAFAMFQKEATKGGRCPSCGRRDDSEEAKLFKALREDVSTANARADRAEAKVDKLTDERDALKVRNADLRAQNKELRAG
jgi:hypothetical protein